MNSKTALICAAAFLIAGLGVLPAKATDLMKTATTGELRIELHVMAAEPFYSAEQVKADPKLEGMLIIAGAKPLSPDAPAHPNCHLIVHVFDAQTGNPLSDAKVSMKYQMLDKNGKPQGAATAVPVVVMQVIGKGAASTHYGNNVVLPGGTYAVTVAANGNAAVFHIDVPQIK